MSAADFLDYSLQAGLALALIALVLGFIRLWRGPVLADRLVALEMMTNVAIGFCGLFALQTGVAAWLDIALALALVSFVSTVAFARYAGAQAVKSGGKPGHD